MTDRNTYRAQFAAYFAGRLCAEDATALEHALARDPKLAREAEAMRLVVDELARESAEEPAEFRLSADRLAVIRAAASKQIVVFPGTAVRASSRRDVLVWRKLAPGVAAAVAVVIGAVSGFTSGRDSYETNGPGWQVATQVEQADAVDGDFVHYYPPAYGLDHHVYWPARSASAVGFASSTPITYGLPGPAPSFPVSGSIFILQ
jgi:hypothetical protein